MNLPGTSLSGNIHGMPLAHLLGHGDQELSSILGQCPAVKAENVVLIGIHDIDDHERELIRSSGVTAFTWTIARPAGELTTARGRCVLMKINESIS